MLDFIITYTVLCLLYLLANIAVAMTRLSNEWALFYSAAIFSILYVFQLAFVLAFLFFVSYRCILGGYEVTLAFRPFANATI
jgi:hypothetical protein